MILLFTLGALVALSLPAVLAGATVTLACAVVLALVGRKRR